MKRNLNEMEFEVTQRLICKNGSPENEEILRNHFSVESMQQRTKHCSNYFSKFGMILSEDLLLGDNGENIWEK